jgi:GH25 family lysozyme M1 (1,4-beta-N-acetylmuramidase)
MRRFHRAWLPFVIATMSVAVVIPSLAGVADAATSNWTAKCSTNLRTSPKTTATIKKVIATGTVVTATGTVTGGTWAASCPSYMKSSTWLKIIAIGGKSTTSLFGLSAVYGASGLFKSGPNPTPTPKPTATPTPKPTPTPSPTPAPTATPANVDVIANCPVRLRSATSVDAATLSIIDTNTVITTSGTVSGGAWAADCATSVSGSSWYKVVAVGGASTSSLFGASVVYAATGLFRAASTTGYAEGIDISHWQGTVDWAKVRGAGKTFVFAKATEGIGFLDANYASYKAGATALGLKFGAYHFARPGSNDPVKEADWFVDNAAMTHGMLVPVLDLEVTGGLGTTALTSWVKAWLQRVYDRLGVRPMIYVSPSFWRTAMGDSRWFADNGYAMLWLAHWGVTSPSVPASNWGGKSWTFWQYTSDGVVPGISGRVDLDRYRFASFAAVTY